jgi:hypothetical protein
MQTQEQQLPGEELETNEQHESHVETDATQNTEPDTAENTESPSDESDATAKDERKEGNRTQRRIERLLREKYEAKARADYLEQVLAGQQSQHDTSAQHDKPQPHQYATTGDYVDALTDWKLSQREQIVQRQQQQAKQSSVAEKTEKLFADAEALGDFDRDDFTSSVQITPVMAETILESDLGAKIVVHLNANPKDASRIAELSPARQAAEIGKLESRLAAPTPKKSSAPKPIAPLSGTSPKPVGLEDNLSADEWARVRNAQLYGKR